MLHKGKIEKIELKARDVITSAMEDLGKSDPPINLAKILSHYKLTLIEAWFNDSAVGGAYDRDKKHIYVSIDDSRSRQAFTVAHELGHFLLHSKKQDIFYRHQVTEFDTNNEAEDEQEANWFAASLLMPKELVMRFWKKSKDVELLAAYFGVSRSAAYWRLKNIGLSI